MANAAERLFDSVFINLNDVDDLWHSPNSEDKRLDDCC